MTNWTVEALARFFRMTDDADVHDGFWWRANGPEYEPFKILVNCNDLFWWACADCEEVTPDNLDVLERSFADIKPFCERMRESWRDGTSKETPTVMMSEALLLFCARARGMRPQGAFYDQWPPEVAALFDAAGPARGGPDDTPRRAYKFRGVTDNQVTQEPPWKCRNCVGSAPDGAGKEL